MTRDEALKTIQRQAPCPHDSIDASLGDGTVWAKCHDCGATFPQDALARARDAAKQFDDAVEFLQAAQPQAPSVPAGWQLVPVDPTPEMIVTGLCEHIQEPTTEEFCDMYRAMLAAAPPVAQEAAPTQQQPTSPDVRAALLFALYHHQGASSAIGQPIRHALGIERHAPLTDEHCAEADRVDLALRRGAQEAAPADPMDWPLPCDVVVGHGTMRKGVRLGALVSRMKALYEMATGQNADEVAGRSLEQRMAAPGLLQQADAAQEAAGAVAPADDIAVLVDAYGMATADEAGSGHKSAQAYAALAKSNLMDAIKALAAAPAVKRWPFVETPGEFAARLAIALDEFAGAILPAVRNVLIENPPTLAAAPVGLDAKAATHARDSAMLQFLEDETMQGKAPNLVFDDDGNWCVSYTGMQPVPRGNGQGYDETVTIGSIVYPEEWRPSVRQAIQAAMDDAAADAAADAADAAAPQAQAAP